MVLIPVYRDGIYKEKSEVVDNMLIGYLILGFIILSNYINIQLSNESVILLSVISVFFWVVGILIKEKN